jgi:outer membrane lipoprotein-sorting protein
MRRLRTASTRRLTAIVALATALLLGAAIAQAAITGAGPTPSPKALANAVLDAFHAPEPDGITAKIHFKNGLLPSGALAGRGSPLLSGADGRLWIQKSGSFRVELQSDSGDAQIVSDGHTVTVYDASSNTVYRARLPAGADRATTPNEHAGEKLTLAKVQRVLDELAKTWNVSGAQPTSTAGQPTYTVRLSPRDDGGLLGAAELAWDAVRGAPLRAAVYARGQADPVLELEATDVSYDAVPDSAVDIAPPPGATVNDLTSGDEHAGHRPHERARHHTRHAREHSADAVQRALPFALAAPATLAGLPRSHVRLVRIDGKPGALAIYGDGLGAIAVLEHAARHDTNDDHKHRGARRDLQLPSTAVGGATARVLPTALGTVVTFQRDGVAYVVAGSVPQSVAETAARGLG